MCGLAGIAVGTEYGMSENFHTSLTIQFISGVRPASPTVQRLDGRKNDVVELNQSAAKTPTEIPRR